MSRIRGCALHALVVACILLATASAASAAFSPLSALQFDHYFETSATKPNDTRIVTGTLEVLGAVPMSAATASGSEPFVEHLASHEPAGHHMNPLRLRKYLLHVDGVAHALHFNQFDDQMPPMYLSTGATLTVEGSITVHSDNVNLPQVDSYSIGVTSDASNPHIMHQSRLAHASSKYSVSGSNSLEALFVLIDFADAENSCQRAAPSGVSGKDFLNSVLFTGQHHGGKNVADLYNLESNGRFKLGTAGNRIAGPYKLTQFTASQDCNSQYPKWVSAAKAAVAADGYNLKNYGTIVVITPTPSGCFWAGLATLSAACKPGMTNNNPPLCFSAFAQCVPFVVAHELGHNIGLEHSGLDSTNSNPTTSNVYGDWSCTMGNRNGWNRVNAHKAYVQGWLNPSRVVEIGNGAASTTYTLSSIDTPDSSATGVSLVAFTDQTSTPSKTYFFSSRVVAGYSDSLPAPYKSGVNIHYKRSDSQYSWFYTSLSAGASFTAPTSQYKFTVSTFNAATGVATLQVTKPGTSVPPTPSETYSWSTGSWSSCSAACGTGTQTRSVTCVGSVSGTVSSSLCASAGSQPASSQSCTVSNCVSYNWVSGSWSSCSATCGTGTQTRSVSCQSSSGASAPSTSCSGSAPATSQSCYAGTCPTYSWSTGAWSSCSSACGSGTQTRSVTCVNSNGAAQADSLCSSAGSKPSTSQTCTGSSSCQSFTWYTGGWSSCSASCGSGVRSRTVYCLSSGYWYPDSYCASAGAKPSTSESCTGSSSCSTFSWNVGSWSSCSVTCGSGIQTRSVTCSSSAGAAQPDSACVSAGQKPATSQSCAASASCPTYNWYVGPLSSCSVSCGTGTQSRSVICTDQRGYTYADANCASAGSKPATSFSCSPGSCPSSGGGGSTSYSNLWAVGAWGSCIVSCASVNVQTRVVVCITRQGQMVDASTCDPSTKPASSQPCGAGACLEAPSTSELALNASTNSDGVWFSWTTGVYSACSASCGAGVQTRNVMCVDNFGNIADPSECSDSAPEATQACKGTSCNSANPSWRAYSWSECSAECDGGRQHRAVVCVSGADGSWLPTSSCDSATQPDETQACNTQPCGYKFDSECYPEFCGQHGKCQVYFGQMYCVCQGGWTGSRCRNAPVISNVTVTLTSSGYLVNWLHSTPQRLGKVGVYLVPTATNISVVAIRSTDNTGAALIPLSATDGLVGQFVVEVVASAVARAASAPFQLFACDNDADCGGHGSCANRACDCIDGYTGATCRVAPRPSVSTSPCEASPCLNGGRCLVRDGAAVCDCRSAQGFAGDRCDRPTSCPSNSAAATAAASCQNGASLAADCKTCKCAGHWTGAACSQCGLKCGAHGRPSSDCGGCVCDTDRAGDLCQFKFRVVRVGPFHFDSSALTAAANITFNQQLLSDIGVGFGVSPSRLSLISLTRESSGVFASLRVLSAHSGNPDSELDELIAVLQQSAAVANSTFYRAAVSSRLVFSDLSIAVISPPADPDTPPTTPSNSASSTSPTTIIAGCVAGVVGLVAMIAGAVVIKRRRNANSSNNTTKDQAREDSGCAGSEVDPVMLASRSPSPPIISRASSPGGLAEGGIIPDSDVRDISLAEIDAV